MNESFVALDADALSMRLVDAAKNLKVAIGPGEQALQWVFVSG